MKKLGWLLIFLCLAGCEKDDNLSPQNAMLVGKWQLSEFCVSPGDASCPRQIATVVRTQTLEFFDDVTFTEKTPQRAQFQTPIVSSGTYRTNSLNQIALKFDRVGTDQEEVWWEYEIVTDAIGHDVYLTVRPGCMEGCEYTYKQIK